jgi:tetratricopeptide (TPR) repeat protein
LPEHPTEDLLSTYALDPSLVEDAARLDAHLAGCPPCRERLAAIRDFEQLLAEPESWSDAGVAPLLPARRTLSAVSARNRREDADADALLTPVVDRFLTASSAKFVWEDIASRPEYHTGGVIRKLADAADKAQYSVPLRSLILAKTASTIVGMLSRTTYTEREIAALRGVSWKQRANASRQLGRFNDALEALQHAERAFRELQRPEMDLASITFIRATVYFEQQRYDAAEREAEKCTATFAQLGQTDLHIGSRYLQGCIAFEQRQLGQAQLIFDSVLAWGERTGNQSWLATASLALGICHSERRELGTATRYFQQGLLAFRELAILSAEIRCRWGLALVVQREGRHRTAIPRLREVREEFAAVGAVSDAALVTLDIMETFLLLGKPREVRQSARSIVRLFKEAGMVTGALTAADYLKQSAILENVTPGLIEYIRRYFRRVDLQPDLAFVPPEAL